MKTLFINQKMNSLKSGLTINVRKTQKQNIYEARIIFRLGNMENVSIISVEAYSLGEAQKLFREKFKDSLEAFTFDYSDLNLIDDRNYIYGSGKQQHWNNVLGEKHQINQPNIDKFNQKLKLKETRRMRKLQGGGR